MENNDVNNFIASVTVDIVDLVNMDFLENNYIDYLENLQAVMTLGYYLVLTYNYQGLLFCPHNLENCPETH